MLKKFRSVTERHAIPASFIVFVLFEVLILGLGQLLSLMPETLPLNFLSEVILMVVPIAIVFLFGFSRTFKKGNFLKGLLCALPFLVLQLFVLAFFFFDNIGNPDASWKQWYWIAFGVFRIIGVGVREECFYRATIQNILAKKYANSMKGIWLTVIISSVIFGLCHVPNLLFGMDIIAVLIQVLVAMPCSLLFSAIYLRSGSIWAVILLHSLTDLASLAKSTFLNVDQIVDANKLAFAWPSLIMCLVYVGLAIFLLRPSKLKEIRKNLCFADE